MAKYNYSTNVTENMAKAVLRDAPVSTKHSMEIADMIRGMEVEKARQALNEVINYRRAVPFKKFNSDVGHKKGIGPGRYPVKAANEMLRLLNSVEANAKDKALNKVYIKRIVPNKASTPLRMGRQRGREAKSSNIEIVVEEMKND